MSGSSQNLTAKKAVARAAHRRLLRNLPGKPVLAKNKRRRSRATKSLQLKTSLRLALEVTVSALKALYLQPPQPVTTSLIGWTKMISRTKKVKRRRLLKSQVLSLKNQPRSPPLKLLFQKLKKLQVTNQSSSRSQCLRSALFLKTLPSLAKWLVTHNQKSNGTKVNGANSPALVGSRSTTTNLPVFPTLTSLSLISLTKVNTGLSLRTTEVKRSLLLNSKSVTRNPQATRGLHSSELQLKKTTRTLSHRWSS